MNLSRALSDGIITIIRQCQRPTSVNGLSAKSYTALRKKTEIPHVIGRHKCELVDSSVDALSILVFNVLCNNVSNQNKSKQNLSITVTIALTWSAYTQHCLLKWTCHQHLHNIRTLNMYHTNNLFHRLASPLARCSFLRRSHELWL